MKLKDFIEFNTSVSSEMLLSVMSILHDRLPCSQFYFRQRNLFKQKEIAKLSKKMVLPGTIN